ncbi:MAG: hypothetical protein CMI54_01530 [Parcubacteria group bacterium]|nr:hypothetical protein [Parcubacteria group bacterium]|tara:strand:+ start:33076 stop:33315 length:240 start_codon:yes stop_codon:yes gene_type:complete
MTKVKDNRPGNKIELKNLDVKSTFTLPGCSVVHAVLTHDVAYNANTQCVCLTDIRLVHIENTTMVCPVEIEIIIENKHD